MGSIPSTKVLVLVGNYHGAAGFGIGKHTDARTATKYALRRAQRDMIHVSTHNGQLFHDLMGRKNKTKVIIRSVPPSKPGSAPSLVRMVFDFMGIKHASAKIVGSKRRNHYTVVQALFDAFHHHTPPQEDAAKRGLRMQWLGSDRHNPRNHYPSNPKGPRHVPERFRNRG